MKKIRIIVVFLVIIGATGISLAANTWDAGGGGTTTWDTASNWDDNTVPGEGADVTFGTAGSVATLNASHAVGSVTFNRSSAFNLTGTAPQTLTINGSGGTGVIVNGNVNYNYTLSCPVLLGGTQTWYVNSGTSFLISNTLDNNGYDLTINNAVSTTISGAVSGSGQLIKSGTGTVTLQTTNSYSGVTTIEGGTLKAYYAGSIPGNVTNNGVLDFYTYATGTYAGVISGTGSVIKEAAYNLTMTSQQEYTGGTTINNGTIIYGTNNLLADGKPVTIYEGGLSLGTYSDTVGVVTLTGGGIYTGTGVLTASNYDVSVPNGQQAYMYGNFAGDCGLTKSGSGLLNISGTHSYTGNIAITGGQIKLTASNVLPDGAAVVISGGGTLNIQTLSETVGAVTLSSGYINTSAGGTLTAASYEMHSGDIYASLAGSGGLTKYGTGMTISLYGTSSYTGPTSINGGTVTLGAANVLSDSSAVSIASGALLSMGAYADTIGALSGSGNVNRTSTNALTILNNTDATFAGVINGSGTVTKLGTGIQRFTGTNSYTGATTVSAGTLSSSVDGINASSGISVNSGAFMAFDQAADGTYAKVVSGAGNLIKSGSALLVLAGSNTFTGTTYVNAGTLALGLANRLADTSDLTVNDGVFAIGTLSETVDIVTLKGGIISGTTGTLTGSSYLLENGTVTAILGGTGALTKSGTGTVTLLGSNTYSGVTTVSEGTLIGSLLSLQNRDITDNAMLVFNQDSNGTYSGVISGSGYMMKTGAGILTLSGLQAYTGGTVVGGGTLKLGASDRLDNAGDLTVAAGVFDLGAFNETVDTVTVTGGGLITGTGTLTGSSFLLEEGTISAVLGGTGGIVKTGTGIMTLLGTNNSTGTTVVQEGELIVNAIMANSPVSVEAGGILGGSGMVLALSGAGMIEPGNSPGILSVGQVDPSGGLDWSFEFTLKNGSPDYGNPTASLNDVLRMMDPTTPFMSPLNSDNIVNIYLNVPSVANNDYFKGGFYTDLGADFLSSISDGLFKYYIADAAGSFEYKGQNYKLLSGYTVTLSTIPEPADFGDGVVNGCVAKLLLSGGGGGDVPEPSTLLLLLPFIGFGVRRLKRRNA